LCWVFFEIGSCELFAPGWLQTIILLISASRVPKITGVSHLHKASISILMRTAHEKVNYITSLSELSERILQGSLEAEARLPLTPSAQLVIPL
jgi:hypothetical protein